MDPSYLSPRYRPPPGSTAVELAMKPRTSLNLNPDPDLALTEEIKIKSKSKSRQDKSWERGSESGNSPNELGGHVKAHPERFG